MENTNNINKPINKPISLIIEDAKQSIIGVINEINLHPTLLEMVLRDVYNEANELAKAQLNREKAEYEQALAEQNNKQNNNITQESAEK
jgi:hypothetical protein